MNRVVHFEIHADDMDRAQKFYEAAFGWKFAASPDPAHGGYRVIMTGPGMDALDKLPQDPGINGGMMKRNAPLPPDGTSPNSFSCIIGVPDIAAAIAKIDAAGGVPQTDKMDVPGVGQLRYYKDTEGNLFGIIQPRM